MNTLKYKHKCPEPRGHSDSDFSRRFKSRLRRALDLFSKKKALKPNLGSAWSPAPRLLMDKDYAQV